MSHVATVVMTTSMIPSKLLANSTRRTIIDLLREKSYTTGALCERFDLSRFAVMQHLKVLEKAGLVSAEKRGRYRWNHLDRDRLAELESQLSAESSQDMVNLSRLPSAIHLARFVAEFVYATTPNRLFDALTHGIDQWWNSTRPERTSTMCLEAQLGGRLYEQFDAPGNGILYGTIDQYKQDEQLGFMGTMGGDTVLSIVRLQLNGIADGQTVLSLQHSFVGEVGRATFEAFQQFWQHALGEQLARFVGATGDNYQRHSDAVMNLVAG